MHRHWELVEELDEDNHSTGVLTQRMKVVGGWVVRTIASRWKAGVAVAQTFIPDPKGTWDDPSWQLLSKEGDVPHTQVLTFQAFTPAGALLCTVTSRYEAGVAVEQTLLPRI